MKRNLLLAAFGLVAAHLSGVAVLAQDYGEPLPIVPPTVVASAEAQPKDTTKIPAPKDLTPPPAAPAPSGTIVASTPAEFQQLQGNPFCDGCCKQEWGLQAGAGFYYIRPHYDDAPAFTTQSLTVALGGGGVTLNSDRTVTQLSQDPTFAPKIWVGAAIDEGLFIRGSWFRLDATSNFALENLPPRVGPGATAALTLIGAPTLPTDLLGLGLGVGPDTIVSPPGGVLGAIIGGFPAGSKDAIAIDTRLVLQAWDLDVTQRLNCGCWIVNVGGGVRYARIDQTYNAYINRINTVAGAPGFSQAIHMSNVFEGVGPELLLEAKRAIGGTGLAIYGNARAGILFGESRRASATSLTTNALGVPLNFSAINRNNQDDSVPFFEIEGGAEWSRNMGAYTPFIRVGIVGQNYFGVGSPSSSPTSKLGDLGLFGLQVMAGVTF